MLYPQRGRSQLFQIIAAFIRDNATQQVTPADVRRVLREIVSSDWNRADDGTNNGGGGGSTVIADFLTLFDAQAVMAASAVVPGVLYAITGDWNATGTDTTVYALGLSATEFSPASWVLGTGLATVDVAAGTWEPANYTDAQIDALLATKQGAVTKKTRAFVYASAATLSRIHLNRYCTLYTSGDCVIDLPLPTPGEVGTILAVYHYAGSGGMATVSWQVSLPGSNAYPTAPPPDVLALAPRAYVTLFEAVEEDRDTPYNDTVTTWSMLANSPRDPAATGGLPAGVVLRDPYAVGDDASITAAVLDASNTWADGDLTVYGSPALQNAGAPPADPAGQHASILVGTADVAHGDMFDMKNASGSAYRFFYGRRNDGTSGWTRLAKL